MSKKTSKKPGQKRVKIPLSYKENWNPRQKELLARLKQIMPSLTLKLRLFKKVTGTAKITPRVFVFSGEPFENEAYSEQLTKVVLADESVLRGEPDELRNFMASLLTPFEDDNAALALWVSSIALEETSADRAFFLLARRGDGTEVGYVVTLTGAAPAPLSEKGLDAMLGQCLTVSNETIEEWADLLMKQSLLLSDDSVLSEINSRLEKANLPLLTNSQMGVLISGLLVSRGYLTGLRETAQMRATSVLHEAQELLECVETIVKQSSAYFDEKIEKMEKDHHRTLDNLKKSFEKQDLIMKGQSARLRRMEEETLTAKKLRSSHEEGLPSEPRASRLRQDLDVMLGA